MAEVGGAGGLRGGQGPNPVIRYFLLFKNDLIAPKHEKSIKIKMFLHPLNSLKILQDSLKNSINLPIVSRVYQMGLKYSIKLFHVLKDVNWNKTIRNQPDNGTQVEGLGRGRRRFSHKPKVHIFHFLKSSLTSPTRRHLGVIRARLGPVGGA